MQKLGLWRGEVRLLATVWQAQSSKERMRGLLGHTTLDHDEGMLLSPCRLIHTFGMAFPIDVLFLNHQGRVLKLQADLPAGRIAGCWGARHTLELAAGRIAALGLRQGDYLLWQECA